MLFSRFVKLSNPDEAINFFAIRSLICFTPTKANTNLKENVLKQKENPCNYNDKYEKFVYSRVFLCHGPYCKQIHTQA